MKNLKPVLIVENCLSGLNKTNEFLNSEKAKEYILSGTFTEFNIKNRNDRIYTAQKFIPHMNELLERKKQLSCIYGEFDHPDVFDTSLKRISHTIESLTFNKEKNLIEGSIRLLNTTWGKEAKALIDDNCPIFVSSRAAGITESNGEVIIKKLFTYDAVADPGFSSARMALNESLGFNENVNFRIYEVADESKINQLFNMNNEDIVTKQQMEEYSNYLTKEMTNIKLELESAAKNGKYSPEKIDELAQYYSNLNEAFNKVSGYLDYLAENIQIIVNENKSLKETTNNLIKHNDYLAENLNKSIKYSEYLAEKLDKNIDYSEYIAETLSNSIDFAEYIAEHADKNIKYSEYLAENLDKSIIYSEYVAENVDKSIDFANYIAENLDNAIAYSEYLAENVDNNIVYSEYLAENLDNTIKYGEYVAEHVDNNIAYAEYIAENLSDTQAYSNYISESLDKTIEYQKYLAKNIKSSKINEDLETPEMQMGDLKVDDVDKYYDDEAIQVQEDDVVKPIEDENAPVDQNAVSASNDETVTQVQPSDQTDAQPTAQPTAQVQPPVQQTGELNMSIIPGMVVQLDDNTTGEVMATNPQNGIVVVKLTDIVSTEETPAQTEENPAQNGAIVTQPNADNIQPQVQEPKADNLIEVQESRIVKILGDKLLEKQNSILTSIQTLIAESKKRKASDEKEPHFTLFLSESNKSKWLNLSDEDKEKIIVVMNESKYTSEAEVLKIIQKSLTANQKPFTQMLIDKMPETLKPLWESLDTKIQNGIMAQSKLYNLNSDDKIESFWNSRGLNELNFTNEKKIVNENKMFNDNNQLSENEVEKYISFFKNLR